MPRFINGNAKYLQWLYSLCQVSSTVNSECQGSSILMQNCLNGNVKYCQWFFAHVKYLQWLCSLCQVSSTVNLECQGSSILMQNCLNGNVKYYCQWFFAHVKYLQWWYQVSSTINILIQVSSTIYLAMLMTVNAYSYPYYIKPKHYQTTSKAETVKYLGKIRKSV